MQDIISNGSNKFGLIDNNASEECPRKVRGKLMENKVNAVGIKEGNVDHNSTESNSFYDLNFQESEDISSSRTESVETEWVFQILHTNSGDLQAAGSCCTVETITGNFHQDDSSVIHSKRSTKIMSKQEFLYDREFVQDQDKEIICKLCDVHVETTNEYYSHLKMHLTENSRECPVCKKVFRNKGSLFGHLHHHTKSIQCENEGSNKTLHIDSNCSPKKSRSDKVITCKCCMKQFTKLSELEKHERVHTGVKPFKCQHCNKGFTQKGSLMMHERIHTGVKPYICKLCNKAFSQSGHLQIHELIHAGVKPYKCKHCKKTFVQNGHLKRHESVHTELKIYKCKHCHKAFKRHSYLKIHERIHTGAKPYKCNQCEKAFATQSNLKVHEHIHTGIRPYKCSYCVKTFTQKVDLQRHEHIHTGVKLFSCKYCDKAFTTNGNLKKHELVHRGVQAYKCEQCSQTFTRQSSLEIHERVHAGVNPYKCKQCNKTFTQPHNLKAHERIHTKH